MFAVSGKVSKPVANQFKSFALDAIYARAASLFMGQKARPFQNSKMARSRLPGVLEDGRNFASRQGATGEIDRKQHSASRGVRQGGEYRFIHVDPRFRFRIAHHDIKPKG
jgi:hypothetical protein